MPVFNWKSLVPTKTDSGQSFYSPLIIQKRVYFKKSFCWPIQTSLQHPLLNFPEKIQIFSPNDFHLKSTFQGNLTIYQNSFAFLEFLREFKRLHREISPKNRFESTKNRFQEKAIRQKNLNIFRENLTVGAINLSRCASKRILKIDFFPED